MKKLLNVFIVVLIMFGYQSNALAGNIVDTNNVQLLDIVPPATTNSYIKVISLTSVTNGVGGFDYIASLEYHSVSNNFVTDCLVSTNLVSGPWVLDSSKAKYITGSHSLTGKVHYVRYRFFSVLPGLLYKPIMDEW